MRIARIALGLLSLFLAGAALADSSLQPFCESAIEANTQRARWGLELRQSMLANCEGQNMRICSQPYTDQITQQERRDMATLQNQLAQSPVDDKTRFLMNAAMMQKSTAAYMALRGVSDSPEKVANEIYQQCLAQELMDLQAATSNHTLGQTGYPSCPGFASMDVQYLQRCCTPDCYCDVYCQ